MDNLSRGRELDKLQHSNVNYIHIHWLAILTLDIHVICLFLLHICVENDGPINSLKLS